MWIMCVSRWSNRGKPTPNHIYDLTPALSDLCKGVKTHANGTQWVEACSLTSLLVWVEATPLKAVYLN